MYTITSDDIYFNNEYGDDYKIFIVGDCDLDGEEEPNEFTYDNYFDALEKYHELIDYYEDLKQQRDIDIEGLRKDSNIYDEINFTTTNFTFEDYQALYAKKITVR